MKVEWFRGVREDADRKEREQMVRSAKPTLEVLKQLLEARLRAVDDTQMSKADYENPSWAFKQADANGAKRTLQELIQLLTLE